MIAVDTNVVLRLIVNDDRRMAEAATRLLAEDGMFISKTVLLETHWVLTSRMDLSEDEATDRIATIIRYPTVEVEGGVSTHAGVKAALNGLDFEDALHVTSTPDGTRFATFDKKLRKRSARLALPFEVIQP